ncbi:hypothetical protein ELQ90_02940 [Labedella phragmitis]|uniref:Uncharacterized protein n=1 Tax=Labedella phragmitis TaxID=2498849 RepID=A0A3S3Z6J4_9MICO|nr:hypothetical protein [Labedella phragmitis]RWZ52910.1 hypothetical protein ELQ90_02940 [Labedella phragmitis]
MEIRDVHLDPRTFPAGEEGWKITLYLSAPQSRQGWDVSSTQALKRRARQEYELATIDEPEAPPAYVDVSTLSESVDIEDVAESEEPEDGETAVADDDSDTSVGR